MSNPNASRGKRRDPVVVLLAVSAALAAAAVAVFVTNAIPLGVPGEWTWDYHWTGRQGEIVVPLGVWVVFALCVVAVRRKMGQTRPSRLVHGIAAGTLVALAVALQMSVAHLGKLGIRDFAVVTYAPWTNGYCYRASRVRDMGRFLRHYHTTMGRLGMHVRTHPPGGVVFYWLAIRAFDASPGAAEGLLCALRDTSFDPTPSLDAFEEHTGASMGPSVRAGAWTSSMVLMLAAAATPALAYALAAALHGGLCGLTAGALVCVLPGLMVFTPATDQLLCPLALAAVLLCLHGLNRQRVWPWAAAGVLVAGGLFVSLSAAPIAMLVGVAAVMRRGRARTAAWQIAAFALALVLVFAALRAATGFRPLLVYGKLLRIAPQSLRDAYDQRGAAMTYWKWIGWNLGDVLIFAGVPLCLLYGAAWWRRAGRWTWVRGRAGSFHAAGAATLLALNFSGVTLGEAGRLWLMYMPILAVLAAAELTSRSGRRSWPLAVVLALQMAAAVALKLRMAWV